MKACLILLAATTVVVGCASFPDAASTAQRAEQMASEAHPYTGNDLNRRAVQDETQRVCSAVGGAKLTQEQSAAVINAARASMKIGRAHV